MRFKKSLTIGQILDIGLVVVAVLVTVSAGHIFWNIYNEYKPRINMADPQVNHITDDPSLTVIP